MSKANLVVFTGSAAAVLIATVSVFVVQAAAALTVSCTGSVSGNQVTWTATPAGGNAPYVLLWSGDSKVAGNSSTTIAGAYTTNGTFIAVIQAKDVSSTVATSTCSATVTANVPHTPTSTPAVSTSTPPAPRAPRVNPPALMINPRGQFVGRGMIVTSVARGSFQANVWGITYTINWSGGVPRFHFRWKDTDRGIDPARQLAVGDEVSIIGKIDPASPFIVNAKVIRDFSIIVVRSEDHEDEGDDHNGHHHDDHGDNRNDNRGGFVGASSSVSSSASTGVSARLDDLTNQLRNLQNQFNDRFSGHGRVKRSERHGDDNER